MNIHEYQAKEILRGYGIPIPPGEVATTPAEAERLAQKFGGRVVIKAQVHAGGRGKAGGVKLATSPAEARDIASRILGMQIKGLIVHKVLEFTRTTNRSRVCQPEFSARGSKRRSKPTNAD